MERRDSAQPTKRQVWRGARWGLVLQLKRRLGVSEEAEVARMSNAKPRVFVVDDDVSVRESLKLLIDSVDWEPETFGSAHEFLSRPRVLAPSCLLLDLLLPDLNGFDVQKLVADRADMPIIFITGYGDVPTTVRAMKAGAVEFFTKPLRNDLLVSAIRNAIDRSREELAKVADMQHLRDCYASLSRREQEVMSLVVSGRLNKQVGAELGISEITVKAHRGKMMRKMQAGSLPELVMMAARLCLTPRRFERIRVGGPRAAAGIASFWANSHDLRVTH
jgi:FixJ family two-component response regulator